MEIVKTEERIVLKVDGEIWGWALEIEIKKLGGIIDKQGLYIIEEWDLPGFEKFVEDYKQRTRDEKRAAILGEIANAEDLLKRILEREADLVDEIRELREMLQSL